MMRTKLYRNGDEITKPLLFSTFRPIQFMAPFCPNLFVILLFNGGSIRRSINMI